MFAYFSTPEGLGLITSEGATSLTSGFFASAHGLTAFASTAGFAWDFNAELTLSNPSAGAFDSGEAWLTTVGPVGAFSPPSSFLSELEPPIFLSSIFSILVLPLVLATFFGHSYFSSQASFFGGCTEGLTFTVTSITPLAFVISFTVFLKSYFLISILSFMSTFAPFEGFMVFTSSILATSSF